MKKLLSAIMVSAAAAIWGGGAYAQTSGSKTPNPSTTMGNDSSRSDTSSTVTRDSASGLSSSKSVGSSTSGNLDRGGHMADKIATMSEGEFLGLLHHASQMEIEMGRLAKTNASSQAVKDYADRIVKDHKAADDKVTQFAKDNNIQMKQPIDREHSRQMDAKASDQLDKLRGLKGADFDREFARIMVKDHEKLINAAITGRDRFNDSKLTNLIDQLLPTLRQHLETAQKLERGSISSSREKSM
jgi:putative membrane protein